MHYQSSSLPDCLRRYTAIYVIVSPPRCCSTAFARVFWQHPHIRYYSHEPFEITYYSGQPLTDVYLKINECLDLSKTKNIENSKHRGLVIKEMPYQVGDNFPLLASWATKPVMFLIRDPRLNIQSRIRKKEEVGDSAFFPLKETGWQLINGHVNHCKNSGIPYVIVNAADFRNQANLIFTHVFTKFNLEFSETMLSWNACDNVDLDNLDGAHHHLYTKVLNSIRLSPTTEPIPAIDAFSEKHGVRDHVIECLEIFNALQQDPCRILPHEA